MAMQARHHSHDFRSRGGSLFLDEYAGCVSTSPAGIGDTTVLSEFVPGSDLTFSHGFMPRKRARMVADAGGLLEDRRVVLPPAPSVTTQGLMQLPVAASNVQSRAVGSGAASTSGCGREIDALIRVKSERMRAGLEAARRRHAQALVAAVGRAATGRMRSAQSELERALQRNAELEEKARQMDEERQAWMGVARSHEAVAFGLRTSLDQLLQSPCYRAGTPTGAACEGEAQDARSCCFEAPATDHHSRTRVAAAVAAPSSCKWCGGGEACVLLLPCRHLCLCRACDAAVDACPVCAAAKNASLIVLVS